jgi:uncharacterized membrane protein YciS (DUF1049 family)
MKRFILAMLFAFGFGIAITICISLVYSYATNKAELQKEIQKQDSLRKRLEYKETKYLTN